MRIGDHGFEAQALGFISQQRTQTAPIKPPRRLAVKAFRAFPCAGFDVYAQAFRGRRLISEAARLTIGDLDAAGRPRAFDTFNGACANGFLVSLDELAGRKLGGLRTDCQREQTEQKQINNAWFHYGRLSALIGFVRHSKNGRIHALFLFSSSSSNSSQPIASQSSSPTWSACAMTV